MGEKMIKSTNLKLVIQAFKTIDLFCELSKAKGKGLNILINLSDEYTDKYFKKIKKIKI